MTLLCGQPYMNDKLTMIDLVELVQAKHPSFASLANRWVLVYKLNACGFESCCSQVNFRYGAYFKQGVP